MSLQVNDKEITTDTNFINSFTTPDSKFESNIDNNNNEQKLPSFTKVEDYLNKLIPEISTLDGKEKDHGNTKMDFSLVNSLNSKNNNSLSNGIMNNTSTKNGFESITFKESNDKNSLETTHDNIENQSDDKNNVIGNINENLKLSGKEENDRILSEPDAQIINECLLMNGKASNSTENCIKNQINMDYLLNKSKSISDKSKDNPSEHEMIISPIMNSPLKTSDTNKKGNIFSDSLNLDENYIQPPSKNKGFSSNHETDNIMNNIDNNIFEDLSPFDFLQYHDSSQNILPNSKNNTNNINNGSQIFNFNHNPNGAMTQYPLGELNQEFNSIPQKKLPNELNFTSSLLNFNPLLNDDLSNNNNNYNNNNNARFIHLPYNDGAPGSNLNSELVIPNNLTLTPITNMSFSGLNNSNLSNNKCILNNFSTTNNNSSNSGNINQNNFIYPLGLKTNSNPILLSNPLPWNNANPIIQKNNDKNLIFGQVPDTNTMNGQLSYLLNNNNSSIPTFLEENTNDKNILSLNSSSFLPIKDYHSSSRSSHNLIDPSNLSFTSTTQNNSINDMNNTNMTFLSNSLVQKPSTLLDYSLHKPVVTDVLLNYNLGSNSTHSIFDLNDNLVSDPPFYPSLNKSSILQTLNKHNNLGDDQYNTFQNNMNQDENILFNNNKNNIYHHDLLNLCNPTSLNSCNTNELLFNNPLIANSPNETFLYNKGSIPSLNNTMDDFIMKHQEKQNSNESQTSSNKSSEDDLSTLIKINKYLGKKTGKNSFKKEWLKNKLKNYKSLKRKNSSSSSQSVFTMRNLEKESPDKISSISDPLLSLSSISLTKNDHDSPSFSSTSTLNNPKLLMLDPSGNGKNDNLLNENLNPFMKSTKSESMEEQGGKDTSDENTNLLNILNFGSKNKNGKSKKGVGKEKGKEKCKILQKNEQEEVEEEEESIGTIFSDLKKDSSLNLKLMNSNIENDPDILQDTTSSFLIVLEDADLWKKFNSVVNEMIITKSGRCLFPILRFQPINLEPKGQYSFAIDILQASPYKYKYRDKKWISGGIKFFAPPTQKKEYYHPDSPQTGHFWMTHGVSFSKIKLTNHIKNVSSEGRITTKKSAMLEEFKEGNDEPDQETLSKHKSSKINMVNSIAKLPENHFYLSSFFMYEPCLYLIRHENNKKYVTTIKFQETKFLAVTHYQNDKVNQLKKNYNPHAKGFKDDLYKTKKRNNHRNKGKNKSKQENEEEEDEEKEECNRNKIENLSKIILNDSKGKSISDEHQTFHIKNENGINSSPSQKYHHKWSLMKGKNSVEESHNEQSSINKGSSLSDISPMNTKEKRLLHKLSRKRKLLKKHYKNGKNKKKNYLSNFMGNLLQDNYSKSKIEGKKKEGMKYNSFLPVNEFLAKKDRKRNNPKEKGTTGWDATKEFLPDTSPSLMSFPTTTSRGPTPSITSLDLSSLKGLNPEEDFAHPNFQPNKPNDHNYDYSSLLLNAPDPMSTSSNNNNNTNNNNNNLNYTDPSSSFHSMPTKNNTIKFDSLLQQTSPPPLPPSNPFSSLLSSNTPPPPPPKSDTTTLTPSNIHHPLVNPAYKTININSNGNHPHGTGQDNFSNENYHTDLNINDTFLLNKNNTFTLINDHPKPPEEKMPDDLSSLNLNSLLNMENYSSNGLDPFPKI